jgi:hypothetical protein
MIDGTDFCIQQKGVARMGNLFDSHKYVGKSALHYKLRVDIFVGNLVWVEGPYPAGAWPDVKFFNSVLSHCLEPGERVDADINYVWHPDKIKCPHNDCNPAKNLGMKSAPRSRHETYNGRLKNWGILKKTYRHENTQHRTVFFTHVR